MDAETRMNTNKAMELGSRLFSMHKVLNHCQLTPCLSLERYFW